MNAWLRAIDRATSPDEIVAQARDFCCLLSPRDLAALPEDVREIRIEHHDDIQRLRERLEACAAIAKERAFDEQRVGDLIAYMSRASARLGEFPASPSL
jgi:hypothetical protein